ncbi:MAG: dicarboxylate/amino acid:cation symporter, partial [Alphaproteobacteria bacterium]|nr:dicarboxylate/amino acid:cation symporter [Alphaproteobacteria bacterium]
MLLKYLNYLKPLPVQLVLCLVAALSFGHLLDYAVIQSLYTASCLIKDVLVAVLPIIIFAYIFDALLGLNKKAPLLLVTILVMVFLSNIVAVMVSGGVAGLFLPILTPFKGDMKLAQDIIVTPFFELHLPALLSPDVAMFTGIGAGLLASFLKIEAAKSFALTLHKAVTWFLHKTFIPVLPLYVTGFVLKLQHEGSLITLVHSYFQVFILAISLIVVYVAFLYFVGSGFRFQRFVIAVKNMLPAGITGFSIMSSAATMPVTLEASEKNLKDPRFAD